MLKSDWERKCFLSEASKATLTTSSVHLLPADSLKDGHLFSLTIKSHELLISLLPFMHLYFSFFDDDDDQEASQCRDSTLSGKFRAIVPVRSVRLETLLNVSKHRLKCPAAQSEPIFGERFAVPFVSSEKKALRLVDFTCRFGRQTKSGSIRFTLLHTQCCKKKKSSCAMLPNNKHNAHTLPASLSSCKEHYNMLTLY